MGNHRTSKIERIVHRIEEHVEEWRRQDAARHAEAEANRGQLWAEAAEREKLLAKAVSDEKSSGVSPEITKQQRVVFVVSSEEFARTLQCPRARSPGEGRACQGKRWRQGNEGLVASSGDVTVRASTWLMKRMTDVCSRVTRSGSSPMVGL